MKLIGAFGLLLLTGCSNKTVTAPPTTMSQSRAACAADSAEFAHEDPRRDINELQAYWAAHVPGGFGGFYGVMSGIHLKDPSKSLEARVALAAVSGLSVSETDQADYDFLELYGCYRALQRPDIYPYWTALGPDGMRNRVFVGVFDSSEIPVAKARIRQAGYPTEIFHFEVSRPTLIRPSRAR